MQKWAFGLVNTAFQATSNKLAMIFWAIYRYFMLYNPSENLPYIADADRCYPQNLSRYRISRMFLPYIADGLNRISRMVLTVFRGCKRLCKPRQCWVSKMLTTRAVFNRSLFNVLTRRLLGASPRRLVPVATLHPSRHPQGVALAA